MKNKHLYIVVILFLMCFNTFGQDLLKVKEFGENPGNLKMYLYVPSNLPVGIKVALVVALHGCTQDAQTIADQSGWNKLADLHGFIVVYPEQKRINNPSKCFNWFKEEDREGGELSSITEMITYTKANYKIQDSGVYVYGLSAGAVMSVTLLVKEPCLFHTGAILAGVPYYNKVTMLSSVKLMSNNIEKSAEEWKAEIGKDLPCYPNVIVLQGDKDKVVNPKHADGIVKQWCAIQDIDTVASVVENDFNSNSAITKAKYQNKEGELKVIYYTMEGIGHALPIDPGKESDKGGETGMFAVDKDFHSTYFIAKDFGLIKD